MQQIYRSAPVISPEQAVAPCTAIQAPASESLKGFGQFLYTIGEYLRGNSLKERM